jgi:hypothetical protein
MSPRFAYSSESVYLFPVSHANKFHNLLYYDISISMTVLDLFVTANKLVVTVPDSVIKLVVVTTVLDSFVTVQVLLLKK